MQVAARDAILRKRGSEKMERKVRGLTTGTELLGLLSELGTAR